MTAKPTPDKPERPMPDTPEELAQAIFWDADRKLVEKLSKGEASAEVLGSFHPRQEACLLA